MSLIAFAIWVLMGLLAGLLAGFVTKRGGYGRRGDVILGLVGSLGAGGLWWALGVSQEPVAVAVVTFVEAAMLIGLQRWLWPAMRGRDRHPSVDRTVPRRGEPARPVWAVER